MSDYETSECKCGYPDCPRTPPVDIYPADVAVFNERVRSILFNDITHAPVEGFIHLGDRSTLRDYLWEQGWRREPRPEDVTEKWDSRELFRSVDDPEAGA